MDDIAMLYQQLGTIKAVADHLGCSHGKARKALLTAGVALPCSDYRIIHAIDMVASGVPINTAAQLVGISSQCLNTHLPYSRGPLSAWDRDSIDAVIAGHHPDNRSQKAITLKRHLLRKRNGIDIPARRKHARISDVAGLHGYVLGIMWATGSFSGGGFVVNHSDRHYIDVMANHCNGTIYSRGDKFAARCPGIYIDDMAAIGWAPRKGTNSRVLPRLSDYTDFLRAYTEIRGGFYPRATRGRSRPVLCISGGPVLISGINDAMASTCGIKPKRPQRLQNGITYALFYQSATEIMRICDQLDGTPCNADYWAHIRGKLS